jgi:hypothetical protein
MNPDLFITIAFALIAAAFAVAGLFIARYERRHAPPQAEEDAESGHDPMAAGSISGEHGGTVVTGSTLSRTTTGDGRGAPPPPRGPGRETDERAPAHRGERRQHARLQG